MNLFAIGDLHLSHRTNKPMDIFGTHWLQHEEKIKSYWETEITEEDLILIPGDISWAMRLHEAMEDLQWLDQLPGKKICIKGNHDYWWDRTGPLNRLFTKTYFMQNTAYQVGDIAICGTRGWTLSGNEETLEQDQKMIARECIRLKLSLDEAIQKGCREIWVMLHYPPCSEEKNSKIIELVKHYPVTRVIYGHLHGQENWKNVPRGCYEGIQYDLVSADYLGFKPLWLGKIEEKT